MKQRLIQVKNLCIKEIHVEVRVVLGFTKFFLPYTWKTVLLCCCLILKIAVLNIFTQLFGGHKALKRNKERIVWSKIMEFGIRI